MASTTLTKAKIVRVKVEEGKKGLFYATSPDLKGLLVAEPTIDALEESIPKVIADMYAAYGVHVVVTKAGDDNPDYFSWIAIPAEQARAALKRFYGFGWSFISCLSGCHTQILRAARC
jgi:hypothetical protein